MSKPAENAEDTFTPSGLPDDHYVVLSTISIVQLWLNSQCRRNGALLTFISWRYFSVSRVRYHLHRASQTFFRLPRAYGSHNNKRIHGCRSGIPRYRWI